MKKFLSLFFFLIAMYSTIAQTRAVTANGDEVILNNDGSWRYVQDSLSNPTSDVDTNKVKFVKSPNATFLVKSNKIDCGIYLDPKKWSFSKETDGNTAEFKFKLKQQDAYGMLIAEKVEIPIKSLQAIAFENAQNAAPDIKIIKEEYRTVNGKMLLYMQMSGTMTGIKFTYAGYYYSSARGSIQLVTYTSSNLIKEYESELEEFLNGFVAID